MNPNENKQPNKPKRKISPTDLVMMALGVLILIRTPWSNMSSFYYLLFFLYIFCMMMRITNMRKQYARELKAAQQKAAAEQSTPELLCAEPVEAEQTAPVEAEVSEKETL